MASKEQMLSEFIGVLGSVQAPVSDLYTCGICLRKIRTKEIEPHLKSHSSVCKKYIFDNTTRTLVPAAILGNVTVSDKKQSRVLAKQSGVFPEQSGINNEANQAAAFIQSQTSDKVTAPSIGGVGALHNKIYPEMETINYSDILLTRKAGAIARGVPKPGQGETVAKKAKMSRKFVKRPMANIENVTHTSNTYARGNGDPFRVGEQISRIMLPYLKNNIKSGVYVCSVIVEKFIPCVVNAQELGSRSEAAGIGELGKFIEDQEIDRLNVLPENIFDTGSNIDSVKVESRKTDIPFIATAIGGKRSQIVESPAERNSEERAKKSGNVVFTSEMDMDDFENAVDDTNYESDETPQEKKEREKQQRLKERREKNKKQRIWLRAENNKKKGKPFFGWKDAEITKLFQNELKKVMQPKVAEDTALAKYLDNLPEPDTIFEEHESGDEVMNMETRISKNEMKDNNHKIGNAKEVTRDTFEENPNEPKSQIDEEHESGDAVMDMETGMSKNELKDNGHKIGNENENKVTGDKFQAHSNEPKSMFEEEHESGDEVMDMEIGTSQNNTISSAIDRSDKNGGKIKGFNLDIESQTNKEVSAPNFVNIHEHETISDKVGCCSGNESGKDGHDIKVETIESNLTVENNVEEENGECKDVQTDLTKLKDDKFSVHKIAKNLIDSKREHMSNKLDKDNLTGAVDAMDIKIEIDEPPFYCKVSLTSIEPDEHDTKTGEELNTATETDNLKPNLPVVKGEGDDDKARANTDTNENSQTYDISNDGQRTKDSCSETESIDQCDLKMEVEDDSEISKEVAEQVIGTSTERLSDFTNSSKTTDSPQFTFFKSLLDHEVHKVIEKSSKSSLERKSESRTNVNCNFENTETSIVNGSDLKGILLDHMYSKSGEPETSEVNNPDAHNVTCVQFENKNNLTDNKKYENKPEPFLHKPAKEIINSSISNEIKPSTTHIAIPITSREVNMLTKDQAAAVEKLKQGGTKPFLIIPVSQVSSSQKKCMFHCQLCNSMLPKEGYLKHLDMHRKSVDLGVNTSKENGDGGIAVGKHLDIPKTSDDLGVVADDNNGDVEIEAETVDNDNWKTSTEECKIEDENGEGSDNSNVESVQCGVCGIYYMNESKFREHMFIKHKALESYGEFFQKREKGGTVCMNCFRILQEREMKNHTMSCKRSRNHEKAAGSNKSLLRVLYDGNYVQWQCQYCKMCHFSSKEEMIVHSQNCTDRPRYKCDMCEFECFSEHIMGKHKFKVHGVRSVVCDQCGKLFDCLSGLKNHIRVVHDRVTMYCDQCGKSFVRRSVYKWHLKVEHEGLRFKCKFCEKEFKDPVWLKVHEKQHRGVYDYMCIPCQKVYPRSGPYIKHMKKHHGIDKDAAIELKNKTKDLRNKFCPNVCHICKEIYPLDGAYFKHMLSEHKISKKDVMKERSKIIRNRKMENYHREINEGFINEGGTQMDDNPVSGVLEHVESDNSAIRELVQSIVDKTVESEGTAEKVDEQVEGAALESSKLSAVLGQK